MKYLVLLLGISWLAAGVSPPANPSAPAATMRAPVLLELFTSEGCSSCPPADELLTWLDRTQPIPGADLIVVSEHVDYWNRLGWVDQNSSQLFSSRQSAYADRMHSNDVYTPQLLVDGSYQLVGSRKGDAENAIRSALSAQKFPIILEATNTGDSAQAHVSIEPSVEGGTADIYVVLAMDRASSKVTAGENSGRQLNHTAVAYSFEKVGTLQGQRFEHDIHAPLGRKLKGSSLRIIVFAQDKKTGRIVGVAQAKV